MTPLLVDPLSWVRVALVLGSLPEAQPGLRPSEFRSAAAALAQRGGVRWGVGGRPSPVCFLGVAACGTAGSFFARLLAVPQRACPSRMRQPAHLTQRETEREGGCGAQTLVIPALWPSNPRGMVSVCGRCDGVVVWWVCAVVTLLCWAKVREG